MEPSMIIEKPKKKPFCTKDGFLDHVRNSSLFIFHKDWKIRKFCILLLTPVKEAVDDDKEGNADLVRELNRQITHKDSKFGDSDKNSFNAGNMMKSKRSQTGKTFITNKSMRAKPKKKINPNQLFDNTSVPLNSPCAHL